MSFYRLKSGWVAGLGVLCVCKCGMVGGKGSL